MSESNASKTGGGISACSALTITLVALKLCGVIDWSWLWVLAPVWIPISVAALIAGGLQALRTISDRREFKEKKQRADLEKQRADERAKQRASGQESNFARCVHEYDQRYGRFRDRERPYVAHERGGAVLR
jgi:hypothetical protein